MTKPGNGKLEQIAGHKVFLCASFILLFALCSPTLAGLLVLDPEQLDPTDLLMTSDLDDSTQPDVKPHVAEIKAARQQPTPTTISANENFAAQVTEEPPTARISGSAALDKTLKRELWLSNIATPVAKQDAGDTNQLARMIERLSSVTFEPPQSAVVTEPTIKTEPAKTSLAAEPPEQPPPQQPRPKLPYETVTDKTIGMLKILSQDPNLVRNPLELGEVLFHSGQVKEAATFYQQALARVAPNDPNTAADRSWILFQIGNCLRDDDPNTAKKSYTQLIAEYPDSPWTHLAKAHAGLIDWYLQDKPKQLIEEAKQ
jgi:tetratricopeptide (TPR) repeat protein